MATPDPALLVVDDNDDNRYTLGQRLKRLGYTNLTTAVNGREALELLRARTFHLVLLDIMMPELNGYEVLEHMRADARLRGIPVIMISAVDELESVIRCIELGAEDYLPKPFNPTLLRARVGASLEKKRLRDEVDAHLARIEQELEAAREIQLGMVPSDFPAPTPDAPVEIHAALHPARQIGGDLYDFFYRDPQTLCLVVADVSDKGAPAALFMARTKTLVRLMATLLPMPDGRRPGPDDVVARVNEELCRDNRQGMFATVFFAMLDLARRELSYCNAGHTVPYVVDRNGATATLDGARGKPVGIRPTFGYAAAARSLAPGDWLFLYTDGVTEAMNGAGELFEEQRLEASLKAAAGDRSEEVVRRVVAEVRAFAGDAPQSDDIAAMAVRLVDGPAAVAAAPGGVPAGAHGSSELVIRNDRDELGRVARALDELGARHRLAQDVVTDMHVALDEVLANIIGHAYADREAHEIRVALEVSPQALEATVEDDGRPFDPLTVATPDRSAPLRSRRVGGLGIHFVRNLMTGVAYSRVGDKNRIVLTKSLSGDRKADAHGAE
jgi:sigma-B regulation protein RsbU (phosphoserine phosphatase)